MSIRYSAVVPVTANTIDFLTKKFSEVRVRNRGLTNEDRSKITALYVTEHKTTRALAQDFCVSPSTISEVISVGTILLAEYEPTQLLTNPEPEPAFADASLRTRLANAGYVIIDGTFIPAQNAYLPGYFNYKHKQCGLVTLTVTAPDGVPIWFSPPRPGSVHDLTLLKDSGLLAVLEELGLGAVADKGFTGLDTDTHLLPVKKPKGKKVTASMKEFNYWVTRLRIPVETVFARLKTFRSMKLCRRRIRNIGYTIQAALTIHALDGRTW